VLTSAKKSIIVRIYAEIYALFGGVIFLSERPNRATPGGQPDGNPLGEIREGFDEIYGNIDGFSKRAVGSLFDDDASTADIADKLGGRPVKPERPSADSNRPERPSAGSSDRSERPGTGGGRPERPSRAAGREPDSDEAYARYIQTAEQANRSDIEKQRAFRQEAIQRRDEKLSEVSYVSRKRDENATRTRAMEEADLYMSKGRGGRQFNMRNLAAVAAFLVLVVLALLTWQMLSARAQLAAANERIEELTALELEVGSLRIANSGHESNVARLNDQIEEYQSRLRAWEAIGGTSADTGTDNGAEDPETTDTNGGGTAQASPQPAQGDLPYTTINAQGNRVYTMQPNDTLWSIAMRVYGDGARFTDILTANNLTEAQASVLPAGTVLIIPD